MSRLPTLAVPPYALHDERAVQRYTPRRASPRRASSPVVPVHNTPRAVSRIDDFEDRLIAQEKTTQGLLNRAFKVREEILDNLNLTQSTWQEEKQRRLLLQEHIRSITDLVNRMTSDIKHLEDEVRHRDAVVGGTRDEVKNLEVHQVQGVTDLRGRVARCDAAIARLATDLKASNDSIKGISVQIVEQNARLMDRLSNLDSKISEVHNRLDRLQSDSTIQIKHLESDTGQQMQGLDGRTRSIVSELKNQLILVQATSATERERLEGRLVSQLDKVTIELAGRQDRWEGSVGEELRDVKRYLDQLNDSQIKDSANMKHHLQKVEDSLSRGMADVSKKTADDMARLKKECREGFSAVHESITNMKTVMDGKRKILEEQLRKEISQIRKMVVLV